MDVKHAFEQPRLLISREAILHNMRLIRRRLRPGVRVCAMIKADAYGHGADIVIDALRNFECDGLPTPAVDMLGAACLDEALALAETSLPVLVLRPVENVIIGPAREAIEHAILNGWILTLGTGSAADDVARIAMAMSRRALVHVMIDTGMTRCGCDASAATALLMRIESLSALRLVSVGTHLATADIDGDGFVPQQLRTFHELTDAFAAARNGKLSRTVANSGGVFFFPGSHFDMVRPGLSLYGIDPTCRPSMDRPLKPVAKWVAPLMSILPAAKGASVGYGQTWKAPHDTRIGIVPVGYADGYLRGWGNHARMIIHGVAVPVVGRVSMDMATIDLHDVPHAQVNDQVTIMDDDPLSPASAYTLAELAATIPYEVFTRIGSRIKRVAVDRTQSHQRIDSETSSSL